MNPSSKKDTCLNGIYHQGLLFLSENSGPPIDAAVSLVDPVLDSGPWDLINEKVGSVHEGAEVPTYTLINVAILRQAKTFYF
jgi:hypothetical protein